MATPLFPKYNPKKLAYYLLLFLIFFFLLLFSTVDPNNLYIRIVPSLTGLLSRNINGYLSKTNFLKNPSFEDSAKPGQSIPAWDFFGMRLDENNPGEGTHSLSTIDLVTIPRHSFSQTIVFPFPSASRFTLSFSYFQKDTSIKPLISLSFYHFDNTLSTYTWHLDSSQLGVWKDYSRSFDIFKPAYKITLNLDIETKKISPVLFDGFSLLWQSAQ